MISPAMNAVPRWQYAMWCFLDGSVTLPKALQLVGGLNYLAGPVGLDHGRSGCSGNEGPAQDSWWTGRDLNPRPSALWIWSLPSGRSSAP